ncbi:MAG: hypothetical protein ACOX22_09575 [Caldicoprobacterales bacterium]
MAVFRAIITEEFTHYFGLDQLLDEQNMLLVLADELMSIYCDHIK